MSDDTSTIERRLEELEHQVSALTARCSELEDCVWLLTYGKLADPRCPYFNWALQWTSEKEVRDQIQSLASVLNDRIGGSPVDPHHRGVVKGVSAELLDGSGPPELAAVIDAFRAVTGISEPRIIKDLLRAIEQHLPLPALHKYLMLRRSDL